MRLIVTVKEIIVSYWGITRTERVTTTVVEDGKEEETCVIPIDDDDDLALPWSNSCEPEKRTQ